GRLPDSGGAHGDTPCKIVEVLGETIERTVTAEAVTVGFGRGVERRLPHDHAGLAVLFGEGDRHHGFRAALALCFPDEGEDEPRRRNHFAKDAVLPERAAVLRR